MTATVAKADIQRAVRLARGIADKNTIMPILASLRLQAVGSELIVTASDLNVSLTASIKSRNTKEWSVLIAASNLSEIVSNAPGDDVVVAPTASGWSMIKSGKATYKVAGMAADTFPKIPYATSPMVSVDSTALREVINRVSFAACTDESRMFLCGALMESDGAEIRMVATDGHRLCKAGRKTAGPRWTSGVIIPRKGLAELKKLSEQGASIGMTVVDDHLFASQDTVTIAIKLIDLSFPPYDRAIPRDQENAATVDRCLLIEALRRQFMTTETRGVRLAKSSGGITLSCNHPDSGEVTEDVDAAVDGEVDIGFSPKYFTDILNQMTSDQVVIKVVGSLDPIAIYPMSGDDYVGIVMPMRLP